ncbi:MAG: glycosyltransferase [Alphaproteobacteria bacterium]
MTLTSTDIATGDLLVERRILTLAQLDEALEKAQTCNVPLGDILLARRWVKPRQYYKTLANTFGLPFVDLIAEAPDASLLQAGDAQECAQRQTMPWRKKDGRLVIVTANPGPEAVTYARARWGKAIDIAVTSKFDILWTLQSVFRETQLKRAIHGKEGVDEERFTQCSVSSGQKVSAMAGIAVFTAALAFAPIETLTVVNIALAALYAGALIFSIALWLLGRQRKLRSSLSLGIEARMLKPDELPVYTILVPLFRDPSALPPIVHALRQLDYPLAKLDIKIVLEEDDSKTIETAKAHGLEGVFEIIRVPVSEPRTKAKACNYALQFARGEFVTVYCAGDVPEPEQLRKAVTVFRQSSPEMACVQCRYDYYNDEENWIQRRFDVVQPQDSAVLSRGMERLGVTTPLYGMSNHFRLDVLQKLCGWNPYCAPADSDLSIRMSKEGCRAVSIASTTYKGVKYTLSTSLRQQAHELKGVLQALIGHTRKPLNLWRKAGTMASLGLLFQVGGAFVAVLVNPWLWLALGLGLASGGYDRFPVMLTSVALFNLVVGGFLFAYVSRLPPFRCGNTKRIPFGIMALFHWMLAPVAAYRAIWGIIWRIPNRVDNMTSFQHMGTGGPGGASAVSKGGR